MQSVPAKAQLQVRQRKQVLSEWIQSILPRPPHTLSKHPGCQKYSNHCYLERQEAEIANCCMKDDCLNQLGLPKKKKVFCQESEAEWPNISTHICLTLCHSRYCLCKKCTWSFAKYPHGTSKWVLQLIPYAWQFLSRNNLSTAMSGMPQHIIVIIESKWPFPLLFPEWWYLAMQCKYRNTQSASIDFTLWFKSCFKHPNVLIISTRPLILVEP